VAGYQDYPNDNQEGFEEEGISHEGEATMMEFMGNKDD